MITPHVNPEASESDVKTVVSDPPISHETAGVGKKKRFILAGIVVAVAGLILAGTAWFFSSSESTDSPEKAMSLYMRAIKDKDSDQAGKVICKGLTGGKGLKVNTEYRFKELNYRLTDSHKISNTEYRVTIDVDALVTYQGKDSPQKGVQVYKVIKEDGSWKMCGNSTDTPNS